MNVKLTDTWLTFWLLGIFVFDMLAALMVADATDFLFLLWVELCGVFHSTICWSGFRTCWGLEVVLPSPLCLSQVDLLWPTYLHFLHLMLFQSCLPWLLWQVHEPLFSSLSLAFLASWCTQEHLVAVYHPLAKSSSLLVAVGSVHKPS